MSKTDDFNYCTHLIHDFYYKSNRTDLYYQPIIKSELTFEHISKTDNKLKIDIQERIFTQDLKYIRKLPQTNKHVLETKNMHIYLEPFDESNSNIEDLQRSENIDKLFSYCASEIVINEPTVFVQLPIFNFIISRKELAKHSSKILEKIETEKSAENYSVSLKENFSDLEFLDSEKIIKELSQEDIRHIIFQVLYALHKLHENFKDFRHNKLNLSSILIDNHETPKKLEYKIHDNIFKFETSKIVKITDFSRATSKEFVNKDEPERRNDNPYYDIHYFLNTFYYALKSNNVIEQELESFFNDIIPEKFRTENNFTGLDEKYYEANTTKTYTPIIILKNNKYFNKKDSGIDMNTETETETGKDTETDTTQSSSIRETSITELSSDMPRFLARQPTNINSNKKTSFNNNIGNMIRGSRKLITPRDARKFQYSESALSNTTSLTESDYLTDTIRTRQSVGGGKKKSKSRSGKSKHSMKRSTNNSSSSSSSSSSSASSKSSSSSELPNLSSEQHSQARPQHAMAGLMGAPAGMAMPGMEMAGMPQMGMPQMGMPQMAMPGMEMAGMPQMAMQEGSMAKTNPGIAAELSEGSQKEILSKLPENFSGPIPENLMNPGMGSSMATPMPSGTNTAALALGSAGLGPANTNGFDPSLGSAGMAGPGSLPLTEGGMPGMEPQAGGGQPLKLYRINPNFFF